MRKHIDLLSGIGGFYEGAMPSGFDTLLAVERSPTVHGFDAALHPNRKLSADINEPIVLTTMLGLDPGLITAAIPQQEYNLSEDLKTFDYPRANALLSVLRLSWLCQVETIILESDHKIINSTMINQLLADFCDLLGWTRNTCILPLHTVVCAAHSHWFTVLHSKNIEILIFDGWPRDTRENASTIDSMPYTIEHDLR
jgi:site-specific DNA-cytosine methylase